MLIGKTTLIKSKTGNTRTISIPAKIATDSVFPFKDGQTLKISLIDKRLIVEAFRK